MRRRERAKMRGCEEARRRKRGFWGLERGAGGGERVGVGLGVCGAQEAAEEVMEGKIEGGELQHQEQAKKLKMKNEKCADLQISRLAD